MTILNTIEYQQLRFSHKTSRIKVFDTEPFEFSFKRPSFLEIEYIIKKRAETLGKPNLFSSKVLKTIGDYSLGLPGLALWIVRELIATIESQEEWQKITPALVHRIAQYLGFGPALKIVYDHDRDSLHQDEQVIKNRVWPILQDNSNLIRSFNQLKGATQSRKPLLEEMVLLAHQDSDIKRSELQERTGIKESSLTYQCQNLVKEKIVSYSKQGREVSYQLRSPVKEALELTLFSD